MMKQSTVDCWIKKLLMGLGLFVLALLPTTVNGDEQSELNFFIEPVLPSSQLTGGSTGYFDLNLAPGKSDVLGIKIQNNADKAIDIQISAHTAFTNVNGVVEYGKDAEVVDSTLPHSLAELVECPGTLHIESNQSKTVELPIQMPAEEFEGILAGGIRIEEVLSDEKQTTAEEGVAITNAFSYVIGVVVSNHRQAHQGELELIDVFADQQNYRNVFSIQLQNIVSTFVNKLEVEAQIFAANSDEVLYEEKKQSMQMAPNSTFNFPVSLNGERFRGGDYIAKVTARSQGIEWEWEHTFTVDDQTAKRLNQEDVTIDDERNWWMILTIVFAVILCIFVGYHIYRSKKKE
jgi:hypothetical protein